MLVTDLVENIKTVFNKAQTNHIQQGNNWYNRANSFIEQLATTHTLSPFVVALVVAAVSPNQRWRFSLTEAGNLKSADMVITAHKAGLAPDAIKISTFHPNKYKAFAILTDWVNGETAPTYYQQTYFQNAPKTWAFANLLADPTTDHVVIDGHATNLAISPEHKVSINAAPKLTPKRYDLLATAYRIVAADLGLLPHQVQAITWETYRTYKTGQAYLPM